MKFLAILSLFIFSVVSEAKLKQFPLDDHDYVPKLDKGLRKYRTKSLKGTNKIVLTYDDGPHPVHTPKILDLLKKYNAKATFFVLTKKINSETLPIIHRIINEGHILASHDHDHDNNNKEDERTFKQELTTTIKTIESITDSLGVHANEMYYRFPYGAYGLNEAYHHMNVMKQVSDELYGENCINFAFWDIDTLDWVPVFKSSHVAQNVLANMRGGRAYSYKRKRTISGKKKYYLVKYKVRRPNKGGVVLMHDIQKRTIKATETILKYAKKYKWKIIPLSDVKEFSYGNKTCVMKK